MNSITKIIFRKIFPASIVIFYIITTLWLAANYDTMEVGSSNAYESFEVYKESQEYTFFIVFSSYFFLFGENFIIAPILNSVTFVVLYNYFVKIFRK